MSVQTAQIRPGDFVRVRSDHKGPQAGRSGVVVALEGDQARIRFSAKRTYRFGIHEVRKVLGAVRRSR